MLPMRDDDDDEEQTTEDRATQPMEAGGWVSQFILDWSDPPSFFCENSLFFTLKITKNIFWIGYDAPLFLEVFQKFVKIWEGRRP